MSAGLGQALATLDESAGLLKAQGAEAWDAIVTKLEAKWPTLRRIEGIADFEGLKERTWDGVKQALKDLVPSFVPDPAAMLRDLRELAGPLETLLAMAEQFDRAFSAAKRADNRLDFADLERRAFNLLTQPNSLARAELRQRLPLYFGR